MRNRLGIIVDGQGDFAALQARFKGTFKILKTDGPRGHSVDIRKIVHGSRKQIEILKTLKYSEVIVLLDYEMRNISYVKFLEELKRQFAELTIGITIHIAVPNIMMENWYLADIEYLSKRKKFLKDNIKQKNYEGKHGKKELKKLFNKGFTYNEVDHGREMFEIIRFTIVKTNSQSFKAFYEIVETYL